MPGARAVTRPRCPGSLLTRATFGSLEVHVTCSVRSRVWPSLKVPMACIERVDPTSIRRFCGVTAIDVRRPSTTMAALPPLCPEVTPETGSRTEIDACPAALAVTFPLVPFVLLTLTTPVFELFHSTSSDMSATLPSLNVAWAVSRMTSSVASSTVVGWTVMRTMS